MSDSIFQNISQALHFSFLLEGVPAATKSTTQIVIEDLMRGSGRVFYAGYKSSINFQQLNPMEIRAQCAMVRGMVNDHLTEPEKFAIWARYGTYVKDQGVFTLLDGIKGIAHYIEPMSRVKSDELLELVGNFYALAESLPIRGISERYGIPYTNLARARQIIARHTTRLEIQAFDRLNFNNINNRCDLAGIE